MKKYIIYAPKYSKSNGVRVLYKLRQLLEKKGYEAYIYSPFSAQALNTKYLDKITYKMRKKDIIIYPEITYGNPHDFQNVVRYILYYPGKNGGELFYDSYEKEFTFHSLYKNNTDVLYINTIDRDLFYTDNTEKDINAYFVYKGGLWKEVEELKDAVEINSSYPKERKELAQLLRRTKTLYSYDRHTLLLDEALLCGCDVKIITEDGFEDYKFENSQLVEPEEIGLDNFIEITQKMNYKGKIRKYNKLIIVNQMKDIFKYSLKYFMYKFIIYNEEKFLKYKKRIDNTFINLKYRGKYDL